MKVIKNILITIYVIIAAFTTICLLSFNDYRVTVFGDKTFICVDKNSKTEGFKKGDLAIAESDSDIKVGDNIFFYNAYEKNIRPTTAKVEAIEQITDTEKEYSLSNGKVISGTFVIGAAKDAKKIAGLGTVLTVLESKWGFLFLIVLPVLVAFIYEIYTIVIEVKDIKRENEGQEESTQEKDNKDKE